MLELNDPRFSSSAIRDLLVHARQPHVISLAGGLPAPELLPTARFAAATARVLDTRGPAALQYGLSEGEPELRDRLGADLITAGSQQALDLVLRVMAPTEGEAIAIGDDPTYVGALQAIRANGYRFVPVAVDEEGLCVDQLEELLDGGLRPTVCYTNPTFQNPTGAVLSHARAARLLELAERYGFLVIADDPYVELWLGQRPPEALFATGSEHLVRLGSMSKTLAPGLRLGWVNGPRLLIERMTMAKQAADLQTSTLNQLAAAEMLDDEAWWCEHLDDLRSGYRLRRDQLLAALDEYWPEATRSASEGGFFVWLRVPGQRPAQRLNAAIEAGVAFVPGTAFGTGAQDALRLSYSSADPARFAEAVQRLRETFR